VLPLFTTAHLQQNLEVVDEKPVYTLLGVIIEMYGPT